MPTKFHPFSFNLMFRYFKKNGNDAYVLVSVHSYNSVKIHWKN